MGITSKNEINFTSIARTKHGVIASNYYLIQLIILAD